MAIAEHSPGKLYARNRGLANMTHQQLHDFASTSREGLPKRKKKITAATLMGHKAPARKVVDDDEDGY